MKKRMVRSSSWLLVGFVAAGLAVSAGTAQAEPLADKGWEIDVLPFPIWIPDASGRFGTSQAAIGYDLSHGDIVNIMKDLEWGFTGAIEARKSGWILYELQKGALDVYSMEDSWGPVLALKASF